MAENNINNFATIDIDDDRIQVIEVYSVYVDQAIWDVDHFAKYF